MKRRKSQTIVFILAVLVAFAFAYNAEAQAELVAYWKFDEGTGSIAYDSSGYNNDGIIRGGATWTSGRYGDALYFDGINGEVRVNHSASLSITGDLTVEAWFMMEEGDGHGNIVTKWWNIGNRSWLVDVADRKVRFVVSPDGTTSREIQSEPLEYGKWYHVVAEHVDGKAIVLYLNGVYEASAWYPEGIYPGDSKISIGRYGSAGPFKGIIDEVKVYRGIP